MNYIVSRIQNRRGLQVNLPQPLRPGEFGLCLDTSRLYIGGVENEISPGIQILPDLNLQAQSILDNQIIIGETSASFDLSDFITYMSASVDEELIYYSEDSSEVFLALEASQIPDQAAILSQVQSYSDITDAFVLSGAIVDPVGSTAMSSHIYANAISLLMNRVYGSAIAVSKLNIEVYTEAKSIDDLLFNLEEKNLETTGTFTEISGFRYDLFEDDSFFIRFSLHSIGGDYKAAGDMRIVASTDLNQANLTFDLTEVGSPTGAIDFRAVISGSEVVIEYTNTMPSDAIMKANMVSWLGF